METVGWSGEVTIGWPTIRGATAQQLYITVLYLAPSFHYSLSTLLSRVICAVRKVKKGGDKEIGGRATDTEGGRKKNTHARMRGEMTCFALLPW